MGFWTRWTERKKKKLVKKAGDQGQAEAEMRLSVGDRPRRHSDYSSACEFRVREKVSTESGNQ